MNLSLFTQYQVPQTPKAMTLHKLKPQFASELNREWHSRLPIIHWSNIVRNRNYICYGACYDWQYFGVGIWSSPVNQNFDFDTVLELRRLAIAQRRIEEATYQPSLFAPQPTQWEPVALFGDD